jgi:multidrug transporter EmrE-like cation transporter
VLDPLVVGLVLFVVWNVLLKTSGDPLLTAFVGMLGAMIVAVPVGILLAIATAPPIAPDDARDALALAFVSGLVEAMYFVLLSRAYRHGDLSVVYPTARGTAPLVAVLIGIVLLGERLSTAGALGVMALLAGIVLLQRPWRLLLVEGADPAIRIAAVAALATGVAVAVYSAIDRVGVRLVDAPLYAALLWPSMVAWLGLALVSTRGIAVRRAPDGGATPLADSPEAVPGPIRMASADPATSPASAVSPSLTTSPILASPVGAPSSAHGFPRASSRSIGLGIDLPRAVVGGLLTYAAYLLVLVALTVAPLTAVAPLRESAVVLAAAWGAIRLGEAMGRADVARRILAGGLVVLGIALLVLEGA